jgi:hypothetical protein
MTKPDGYCMLHVPNHFPVIGRLCLLFRNRYLQLLSRRHSMEFFPYPFLLQEERGDNGALMAGATMGWGAVRGISPMFA